MEGDSCEPEKTVIEVVKMLENGSLQIAYNASLRDGPRPSPTVWTSAPGSPDFIEFGERHGVTKPGQMSTIIKKQVDGVWHQTQERSGD